jgi:hypothetical protein
MLYPLVMFGVSDRFEPSPIYTMMPDGSRAEVSADPLSYVYAVAVGLPLFVAVLSVPFIYHYCFDKKNAGRGSRRRY